MRRFLAIIILAGVLGAVIVGCAGSAGTDTSDGATGIAWVKNDLPKGLARAKAERKTVFLYFGAAY